MARTFKLFVVGLVALTLFGVTTFSVSIAQGPVPSSEPAATPPQEVPHSTMERTASLEAGKELVESLTPEQQAQIQAIVARHQDELDAITAEMTELAPPPSAPTTNFSIYVPLVQSSSSTAVTSNEPNNTSDNTSDAESPHPAPSAIPAGMPTPDKVDPAALLENLDANIQTLKEMQSLSLRLQDVQTQIDQEIAGLLTPEQQALHEQVTAPINKRLEKANAQTARLEAQSNDVSLDSDSGYVYYAGLYGAMADYYSYYAYYYAYYGYSYGYCSYYTYYYSDYAATYAETGLYKVSAAYFDLLVLGFDFNDGAYDGMLYFSYATDSSYYGKSYAYSDYSSYPSDYAYYAYVYGDYANTYNYYAYIYAYYGY